MDRFWVAWSGGWRRSCFTMLLYGALGCDSHPRTEQPLILLRETSPLLEIFEGIVWVMALIIGPDKRFMIGIL